MKMNRVAFRWGISLGALLTAVAASISSQASDLSYGVRNAFAANQPMFRQHDTNGFAKLNEPGRAGLGDELRLEVVNFDQWRTNQGPGLRDSDLVVFLDRQPMKGLHVQRYAESDWDEYPLGQRKLRISYFGVRLEQNTENSAAWKNLLHSPQFDLTRPIEVSLGFPGGEPMNTWVYPTALQGGKPPFSLVILRKAGFWVGMAVIVGAFVVFFKLARYTDLLRDPAQPRRPDGRMPLSLARTQMAFWFFFVFGAFFFLWLVTGRTDTLNSSILTLIGISAGTAVGSAFLDQTHGRDLHGNVAVDLAQPEAEGKILQRLAGELEDKREALKNAKQKGDAALAKTMESEIETLTSQIEFFRWPLWRVAMQDLLNESGIVSFHRFQMVVWTVVLGIIFLYDVYSRGTMPNFDAALLGLMGVSAGTFIGFKLPSQSK